MIFRICTSGCKCSGGIFEVPKKSERLEEVVRELEDPAVWQDPERAKTLGRERAELESIVHQLTQLRDTLGSLDELLELAREDEDPAWLQELTQETQQVRSQVEALEFRRMFSGKMDAASAYVDIQSGSGGTEAQDWAEMLLRMYLRWAEHHGFYSQFIRVVPREKWRVLKVSTVHVVGEYAYGWLRTETGVHRLVRKSPFRFR
jgi:Protein chain release factor B